MFRKKKILIFLTYLKVKILLVKVHFVNGQKKNLNLINYHYFKE